MGFRQSISSRNATRQIRDHDAKSRIAALIEQSKWEALFHGKIG